MKLVRRIRNYFMTHFAALFILILGVTVLSMMLLLQSFLRTEYFQYLKESTYETQNALLGPMQESINASLTEIIMRGSEIAIDDNLYDMVQRYARSEEQDSTVNNYRLSISDMLKEKAYSTDAVTVAIAGRKGLVVQYDRYRATDGMMWNEENNSCLQDMVAAMIDSAQDKKFPRVSTANIPEVHPAHNSKRVFHISYPLTGGKESIWKTEYVLVISYSLSVFDGFLDAVEIPEVEYLRGYVAGRSGEVLYYSSNYEKGDWEQAGMEREGIRHLYKPLRYFDWTLNIIIDEARMRQHIDDIYNSGVFMYGILLIFGIIIIFSMFRRLMHPVGLLSDSMQSVEAGDYKSKIAIKGEHEIWQVAEEYNRMIDAIHSKNKQIEQQHREKMESIEQKHQAEREALESQINAHFICNTLGCINYEAIEEGNDKVSLLIKKLSNILRYTFDQRSQEVYMYQEIAWIDQYLYLQQSRLETFDYEIDFPELYGHWPCCKLMFQPFVENSILHGFEGRKGGGRIRIAGQLAGERLQIVIEDNGCGMDEQTEQRIRQIFGEDTSLCLDKTRRSDKTGRRLGIGVRNVVTRMRMYYGSRFELSLETVQGKGTKFTFLIPIPEAVKGEEE